MIRQAVVWALGVLALAMLVAPSLRATTIDFGSTTQALPYSEDGLTISALPGSTPGIISGSGGDGHLRAGNGVDPIRIRISSPQPFHLISLDVEQLGSLPWWLAAPSGDILIFSSPGTINTGGTASWRNMTYFDIVHTPPNINGFIYVDNIVFVTAPEPGVCGILVSVVAPFIFRRARPG